MPKKAGLDYRRGWVVGLGEIMVRLIVSGYVGGLGGLRPALHKSFIFPIGFPTHFLRASGKSPILSAFSVQGTAAGWRFFAAQKSLFKHAASALFGLWTLIFGRRAVCGRTFAYFTFTRRVFGHSIVNAPEVWTLIFVRRAAFGPVYEVNGIFTRSVDTDFGPTRRKLNSENAPDRGLDAGKRADFPAKNPSTTWVFLHA